MVDYGFSRSRPHTSDSPSIEIHSRSLHFVEANSDIIVNPSVASPTSSEEEGSGEEPEGSEEWVQTSCSVSVPGWGERREGQDQDEPEKPTYELEVIGVWPYLKQG